MRCVEVAAFGTDSSTPVGNDFRKHASSTGCLSSDATRPQSILSFVACLPDARRRLGRLHPCRLLLSLASPPLLFAHPPCPPRGLLSASPCLCQLYRCQLTVSPVPRHSLVSLLPPCLSVSLYLLTEIFTSKCTKCEYSCLFDSLLPVLSVSLVWPVFICRLRSSLPLPLPVPPSPPRLHPRTLLRAAVDAFQDDLKEHLKDNPAELTRGVPEMIEVLPEGASKATGLEALLRELGIAPHEVNSALLAMKHGRTGRVGSFARRSNMAL